MRKSEIPLIEEDKDLVELLNSCTDEDLSPLVSYILGEDGLRMSSQLDIADAYKRDKSHPTSYALEIAAEIQKFGGNTLVNQIARGGKGVSYISILKDVAGRMKVNFNDSTTATELESQILLKVLEKSYEKMTDEERAELLKTLGQDFTKIPKALPVAAIQLAIRAGGFAAYQIAVIVANGVARMLLGRGLSFAAGTALTRTIGALAGPIGWAITAIWTLIDLAGPAYRVTIPCVIHCAFLRQSRMFKECQNGHFASVNATFCPDCGEKL